MRKLPLIIAGIIFLLVALMHLLRLVYHWEIIIAGQIIPMSVSVIGLIIAAILAFWLFRTASRI